MFKKISLVLISVCLISGLFIYSTYQHTSSKRLENKYSETISIYKSKIDKDHDGLDDQSDLLDSAIKYINTKPHYKSEYYEGGYPTDHNGVCSDVVAQALNGAGYDLQKLVDQDIKKNRSDYSITTPDSNIDFRRVKNLQVFFKNNTTSLTTDISKIKEWQGGDIVIFKNHIGIVSDRRNKNGVPYLIHHNSPWQSRYEEDILEKRKDIVGHYRFS